MRESNERCALQEAGHATPERARTERKRGQAESYLYRAAGPFFERNKVSIIGERVQLGRKGGAMVVSEERNKRNLRESKLRSLREASNLGFAFIHWPVEKWP